LAFRNLQLAAKNGFTDLRSVGKAFTGPLRMVGVNDVDKGFTDRLWVGHFKFYRPSVGRHTKMFY
jgi:hypothetical protein